MIRRKKPPQQRKVHQITDPSGWTHVTKGPPGIIDPSTIGIHLENGKFAQPKYTQETYRDRLRTHYAPTWRASTCFGALSLILERDILPAGNLVITQCVCLGLGSLTAGSESSSYELAALVSILEILGTLLLMPLEKEHKPQFSAPLSASTPLPKLTQISTGKKHHIRDIIFQDPVFNALDRSVLQGLGYTVVEIPDALAKLNGTTFLFAPHLECCHYATALGTATPVLSVGSDLHVYVDG